MQMPLRASVTAWVDFYHSINEELSLPKVGMSFALQVYRPFCDEISYHGIV